MIDLARVFPELVFELKDMPDVVLDGELVMLGEKGHPAFERLFRRAAMRRPQMIEQAAATEPAAIFAFDLLSLRARIYARCRSLSGNVCCAKCCAGHRSG